MGIEYYAFALFITALICLIAILCKLLFSNVKQQHKLLDEKEAKLLQLYHSVESIMEEFNDQVKATTEELNEYEIRLAKRAAAITTPKTPEPVKTELPERLPRAERVDPSRIRVAGEMLARAERIVKSEAPRNVASPVKSDTGTVFQRLFDETAAEPPPSATEASSQQARNEAILALAAEGKTDAQIASELGITRNEVKLVIGLMR